MAPRGGRRALQEVAEVLARSSLAPSGFSHALSARTPRGASEGRGRSRQEALPAPPSGAGGGGHLGGSEAALVRASGVVRRSLFTCDFKCPRRRRKTAEK